MTRRSDVSREVHERSASRRYAFPDLRSLVANHGVRVHRDAGITDFATGVAPTYRPSPSVSLSGLSAGLAFLIAVSERNMTVTEAPGGADRPLTS